MFNCMLQLGASVDAPDKTGRTALMMATESATKPEDGAFISAILEARADVNATDRVHCAPPNSRPS